MTHHDVGLFLIWSDGCHVTWTRSKSLSTGVPQGSVFSPFLFCLYTHSHGQVHIITWFFHSTAMLITLKPSSWRLCFCTDLITDGSSSTEAESQQNWAAVCLWRSVSHQDLVISLENFLIIQSDKAWNLGGGQPAWNLLDNQPSFFLHTANLTCSCSFPSGTSRRLRWFLSI